MKRRSKAGSAKSRRRKTAAPKRGNAPNVVRNRSASIAGQETVVARLTYERDEVLEQQGAAAEVLKIISASQTELEPVLEVVVRSAARYCKADDVTLFELDGQDLRATAHWGAVPHLEGLRFPCTRGSVAGRVILERMPVHVIDLQAEAEDFPEGSAMARRFGHRTIASVPLLREGVAVGTLQLRRTEVNPFTDKQIALLGTFAAQALIAIENARLLGELRQRTADLSESLQQQTASADVLRIISSSPGELQPVFEAMLQNAVRICDARFGSLALLEGDGFRFVALHGAPPKYRDARQREPFIRTRTRTNLTRVLKTKQVVQIADIAAEEPDISITKDAGARTLINVPMLKDDDLIGIIAIYRQEVRPFNNKQIELVKNFAAQAVIAIENARLLNELRQRTNDLSEALEQQTATSEVLRVISSSPGDLQQVFEAMLQNAVRVCDAKFGTLFRFDDKAFHFVAEVGTPPALAEFQNKRGSFLPLPGSTLERAMQTHQVCHAADVVTEAIPSLAGRLGGARSVVCVPMLHNDQLVGALVIYRPEVRPFTERQIELLRNFADQAVIAIENARLLNELRQRTEEVQKSTNSSNSASPIRSARSSAWAGCAASCRRRSPI